MKKPSPKLTRSQLVFVAECIIAAAIDRADGEIESPHLKRSKHITPESEPYVNGAIESAGMALAILAAQITGEGVSIGDALMMVRPARYWHDSTGLREMLEADARHTSHDPHKYAVEFVKNVLDTAPAR